MGPETIRAALLWKYGRLSKSAIPPGVRPTWKSSSQPSQYEDIALVASFMEAVLQAWVLRAPELAPSNRDLDKFLMMYGKAIKERSKRRPHMTGGRDNIWAS